MLILLIALAPKQNVFVDEIQSISQHLIVLIDFEETQLTQFGSHNRIEWKKNNMICLMVIM